MAGHHQWLLYVLIVRFSIRETNSKFYKSSDIIICWRFRSCMIYAGIIYHYVKKFNYTLAPLAFQEYMEINSRKYSSIKYSCNSQLWNDVTHLHDNPLSFGVYKISIEGWRQKASLTKAMMQIAYYHQTQFRWSWAIWFCKLFFY